MANAEMIAFMKKRVDELTYDEMVIVKDYCEQKILKIDRMIAQEQKQSALAGTMLLEMFKSAGL